MIVFALLFLLAAFLGRLVSSNHSFLTIFLVCTYLSSFIYENNKSVLKFRRTHLKQSVLYKLLSLYVI